jgi:predicted RNA-binding Zn-ribbon protein involved in translation (DUF1610 family)
MKLPKKVKCPYCRTMFERGKSVKRFQCPNPKCGRYIYRQDLLYRTIMYLEIRKLEKIMQKRLI